MSAADGLKPALTMKEACAILRICRRSLQDLVSRHPFYYGNGVRKLFTETDIASLQEAMRRECGGAVPTPPAPGVIKPLAPYKDRQEDGFIYFLHAHESQKIKIGFAVDPGKRLKVVMTGCPEEASILGTMPGTRADERALHLKFKALRVRGEWFRANQTLVNFILKETRKKP